ncbi:hypothetical protein [Roseicella sp. DB1501]|uniref:phage tail terminator protein n=1 Tax=Roseicella sp. DB1501 TaxID=2730925 RepID=UPI0014918820|nr:hypothetical protein [Roseicella sp. DB1501]NOG69810.1 hypothetical protein [Roseicella sp. DB1501]
MNIPAIIQQLRTYCPTLKVVGGAADYERASRDTFGQVPAAYVIPRADDASPNEDQTQLQQRVLESFGVILVLDNTPDRRGQTSTTSVESMKYEVHGALLNWRMDPTRTARGLWYDGGHMVDLDGARLFWEMVYTSEIFITEADGFQPDGDPLLHIEGHTPDDICNFDTALPQS